MPRALLSPPHSFPCRDMLIPLMVTPKTINNNKLYTREGERENMKWQSYLNKQSDDTQRWWSAKRNKATFWQLNWETFTNHPKGKRTKTETKQAFLKHYQIPLWRHSLTIILYLKNWNFPITKLNWLVMNGKLKLLSHFFHRKVSR